jgi:collagenase-like protein with putative collagen-binding domain
VTVEMGKFDGSVTAKWYDPTSGNSNTIAGSPFANTGSHGFSTPGNNSAGDPDWVLLLTTN